MVKKNNKLTAILNKDVKIEDSFWTPYQDLIRNTVIPYQWEALNDRIEGADKSFAVSNFKIAAGLQEGQYGGWVFQDSDVAKWLEAVAYSLELKENKELETIADEMIDIIEKAQMPDGYLNTFYTIKEPGRRWSNLYECHELYCAGHMLEAATAYYKATGKRKLLDIMTRFIDHINDVFGPEEGKIKGYPGHQEIELALMKLYDITRDEKHLKLAKFFIDERGKSPNFFYEEWKTTRDKRSHYSDKQVPPPHLEYNQAHLPVVEQKVAVGHAVRAVYMYTGMADVAGAMNDVSLLNACKTLWNNITKKQMYITGGIGATHFGEAFTFDYDLPNDDVYAETCASIGLIFFANRMIQIEQDSQYADVLEKALYNTVLASMEKDGKHFFYVNPLEVYPKASQLKPERHHVKAERQKWFGCACCPPNVARLLTSLGSYIYSYNENTIYTHLFISSESQVNINNTNVNLKQTTNYPLNGTVQFEVSQLEKDTNFTLAIRKPGWCNVYRIKINGKVINAYEYTLNKGYIMLSRTWSNDDQIEFVLDMPVEIIESNPLVRDNAGKVALMRGPLVYCLEQVDNGENLSAISLPINQHFTFNEQFMDGVGAIDGEGYRTSNHEWDNTLYRSVKRNEELVKVIAVPYFYWGNRQKGEMLVWVKSK